MSIKPFDERVVVILNRKEEKETQEEGLLLLPGSTAEDADCLATVVSVGTGEKVSSLLAPGDVVLFNKYGGTSMEVEGELILILNYDDIYAKITY